MTLAQSYPPQALNLPFPPSDTLSAERLFGTPWENRPVPPEPTYLLENLLPVGSLVVVVGEPGIGKTRTLMEMGNAVANGLPFHDLTTMPAKVLHVDYEMGERALLRYGNQAGLRGDIVPVHDISLKDLPALIRRAHHEGCRLVVLDSYTSLANQTGVENAVNTNGVAEQILKPLSDLAHQLDICIVVLHHTNKTNQVFDGSQRIKGVADIMYYLRLDRNTREFVLKMEKTRYGGSGFRWSAADHPLLEAQADEDVDDERPQELHERWLGEQLSAGPVIRQDLMPRFLEEFKKGAKTLERALKALRDRGALEDTTLNGHKAYQLVDAPPSETPDVFANLI